MGWGAAEAGAATEGSTDMDDGQAEAGGSAMDVATEGGVEAQQGAGALFTGFYIQLTRPASHSLQPGLIKWRNLIGRFIGACPKSVPGLVFTPSKPEPYASM